MPFRISQRVGYDEKPSTAALPWGACSWHFDRVGVAGHRKGEDVYCSSHILKGWPGNNLYSSLAGRVFPVLRSIWVLNRKRLSLVFVLSFWVTLSSFGEFLIEINAESVWRVLVWDKSFRFTCMWTLVVQGRALTRMRMVHCDEIWGRAQELS